MQGTITVDLDKAFVKKYTLRLPVRGNQSVSVTLPFEIVDRELRRANVDLETFVESHEARFIYDDTNTFVQLVAKGTN